MMCFTMFFNLRRWYFKCTWQPKRRYLRRCDDSTCGEHTWDIDGFAGTFSAVTATALSADKQ